VLCLQVAYPLPKMDLVAIPNFAAGAMENWGLLTYRETALLASDTAPDMKAQYDIATTVAHETVRQAASAMPVVGVNTTCLCT
jgi:puromycin-sensitive aminopeptidase